MLPILLPLAQSVDQVQPIEIPGAPWWANMLLTLVMVFVIPVVGWYLQKMLKAQIKNSEVRLENENLTRAERLEERFKRFALMRASGFVERDFFEIAEYTVDRLEKGDDATQVGVAVKDKLTGLADRIKADAQAHFGREDIDIVEELGETKITQIIEWAANQVSPFPGKPTVESMLTGGADKLLKRGTAWVREYWTKTGGETE